MTNKLWGKNLLFFLVSISMALVSCVKQDDIDKLQKQIDNLKSNEIATVQQQMSGIQLSLGNLQTVDTELRGYIRTLQDQEGKLAQADEALEGSIASLKSELSGEISAAKSDALAQLEAYKANVSSQLASLRASIDSLKSKDADLQTQITSLQSYIDGDLKTYIDNGDKSVKSWASASFATLAQYNGTAETVSGIQTQIGAINARLDELSASVTGVSKQELDAAIDALDADHQTKLNKAVSDCNAAIASAKEEITAAYTAAIGSAISASESSMKSWVNNQLTGYYTIVQTDSKLSALKTSLEGQLSSQKTYLEGLISNLETNLTRKINSNKTLIDDLQSQINGLGTDMATLSGRVSTNASNISANAEDIASNARSISANAGDIDACERLIAENKRLIQANESAISDNGAAITALQNRAAADEGNISQNAADISANAAAIAKNAEDIAANAALIATNATAISNNARAISDNAAAIAQLRADLNTTKTEITAAYQQAISTAIGTLDGQLRGEIATQVETINSRIDDEVTAINATIDALTARVTQCEKDILEIKSDIQAMQQAIDDLSDKIATVQQQIESINGTITNLQNADAELQGFITALQNASDQADTLLSRRISAAIDSLTAKDEDLKRQIGDLQEYVDGGIQSTKDWASATFLTLAQYDATIGDIAGIQAEITAINSWLGSLKDSYSSLNEALTACEQSMKGWVNEQLTGYYTIAQADANLLSLKTEQEDKLNGQKNYLLGVLDSLNTVLNEKINTNASGIEECKGLIAECNTLIGQNSQTISDNAAAIAQLRTDLNNAKTEITTAYQQAINTAITTLDGQLRGEIATQVNTINSRIDSEVSTINSKIESLTSRVAACENDIQAMKSDIQALRDDVDELQEKVAAILSRIQSITYVPLYSDGKASVDYSYDGTIIPGEVVFDFEIRPASVAAELTQVWETALSMKAVYTITRSALDFVPLDVVSATAQNGILTVTASGSQLKEDFFLGRCSASASLSISDGNNEIASDYIPMIPTTNDVITFNDINLKRLLVGSYDKDGDGEISHPESCSISRVDCSNASITDLTDLKHFRNLKYLNCSGNMLTKLDLSANTDLVDINVSNNSSLETIVYNDCTINATGILIGTYVNVSGHPGIVFYSSGSEVKIVSTDEVSMTWSLYETITGATSRTDGIANTNIIVAGCPAAQWCRAKGPDWYLPAEDEYLDIYNNITVLNTTLGTINAIILNTNANWDDLYWTSTETDTDNTVFNSQSAVSFSLGTGRGTIFSRKYALFVRAVRAL